VPDDVPVVELLGAPCSLAEVIAIRAGRFVPLFGRGATRDEALRALANLARALGADADPRGADHALDIAIHNVVGPGPLRALAQGALDGSGSPILCEAVLAYVGVLGAGDALRERIARELVGPREIAMELALALGGGGGDFGTYRDHYTALSTSSEADVAPMRLMRAWFDFVLARRFAGLDAMHTIADSTTLDGASRWLLETAQLVNGEERSRARLTEIAESVLEPIRAIAPRLVGIVAREMAEIVRHPFMLRFQHLRCAAARDHAAVAIRAWLTAATEPESDEALAEVHAPALGPEPSRAGRAAIEARTIAGEFLLDWFVNDRDAREGVDAFVRRTLRTYHRLRGAQLLARVERDLRPPGGMLTQIERIVWRTAAER
jgi:hypothetical protein